MRKQAGVTQAVVADGCGVTRACYRSLESGRNRVYIDYIVKIARFYGMTVSEFLEGIK